MTISDPGDLNSEPRMRVASRRRFLAAAAAAALTGAGLPDAWGAGNGLGHSADDIAARDAANVAASGAWRHQLNDRYAPLTADVVHFFGYGESLSNGWYGVPVLSTTQPYDNLMIGGSTRAVSNSFADTTWVPVGTPGANGVYAFAPMIATPESNNAVAGGETPGEGALNYFRRAWLSRGGATRTRFVLTNCAAGGHTIAELEKGAIPETFNRLRDAANWVKASATSMGLSYQVGGMIWAQGEQDVALKTSYASYLASLQMLQQSFLTDIVRGIAGQPAGTVVPWFSDQPDSVHWKHTTDVFQALLDWSNTAGSDFYLAGPMYQYPDHSVHLTANGYRWHANQVGKAMKHVMLDRKMPRALHMTGARAAGLSVLVDLYVPVFPLIQGDAYVQYVKTVFPNLGFIVTDSLGLVPVSSVAIVGAATIQIILGRVLSGNPVLQSGYNLVNNQDWGTNICDSDSTAADDVYVYTAGVQDPGEDIVSWNGAPLIGQHYPMNNYLAVATVPISVS